MKHKFKVGDLVRIKVDEEFQRDFGYPQAELPPDGAMAVVVSNEPYKGLALRFLVKNYMFDERNNVPWFLSTFTRNNQLGKVDDPDV